MNIHHSGYLHHQMSANKMQDETIKWRLNVNEPSMLLIYSWELIEHAVCIVQTHREDGRTAPHSADVVHHSPRR